MHNNRNNYLHIILSSWKSLKNREDLRNDQKPYKSILLSVLFIILVVFLYLWIRLSPYRDATWAYPDSQYYAATLLRGEAPFSEISQDAYGFRAIVYRWNAYLPLDMALIDIHENWIMPTTHPPTAFLFAAPVAFLNNMKAATIWAWLCLAALSTSLKLHGFGWFETFFFTIISFLWLPTIGSLGQLTPIWLLCLSLANFFRNRHPFAAGIFIAMASMTKYLPALLLVLLIIRRKWSGLYSFILVWGFALAFISILSPDIFKQYIHANAIASPFYIAKTGGFIFSSYKSFGFPGLILSIAFLLMILIINWKELFQSKEISSKSWMIFSLYAVALLPISWGYSYFPLYPGMLLLCKEKRPVRIFGFSSLIITAVLPMAGMILYGFGLAWPETLYAAGLGKSVDANDLGETRSEPHIS